LVFDDGIIISFLLFNPYYLFAIAGIETFVLWKDRGYSIILRTVSRHPLSLQQNNNNTYDSIITTPEKVIISQQNNLISSSTSQYIHDEDFFTFDISSYNNSIIHDTSGMVVIFISKIKIDSEHECDC